MFNNDKLLMAVVMSLQFRGGATAFRQLGQDFASGGQDMLTKGRFPSRMIKDELNGLNLGLLPLLI